MTLRSWVFLVLALLLSSLFQEGYSLTTPSPRPSKETVAVVGEGISGCTIAYLLQGSGRFDVTLLETNSALGGHIRTIVNPLNTKEYLNIGHATHMGMFCNLRLLLRHLGVEESPVGLGSNSQPGLFRMIPVSADTGEMFRPPLKDILSPRVWWDAFWFYYYSYRSPDQRFDDFLSTRSSFSKQFLDILYWAMATFEFDKHKEEVGEYALGAVRALVVTQVFFQYLLCDAFDGSLPAGIDQGLKSDLKDRVKQDPSLSTKEKDALLETFEDITKETPLACYFTSEYGTVIAKLAAGAGRVMTNATVSRVHRKNPDLHILETDSGGEVEARHVVFTSHPSVVSCVLSSVDYPDQAAALQRVESGAVGVRIIHANDLPFSYPPSKGDSFFDMDGPPPILGIFDISELTTSSALNNHGRRAIGRNAGWLSIAFPVYRNECLNRHDQSLENAPSLNVTVYPWTRASSAFPEARKRIEELQGHDGIYIIGQALNGVNKASELQVTNALNLCYDKFGVLPPWDHFFRSPMLPDCNDVDAFRQVKSPLEAAGRALKSLVGSFLITSAVSLLGAEIFD